MPRFWRRAGRAPERRARSLPRERDADEAREVTGHVFHGVVGEAIGGVGDDEVCATQLRVGFGGVDEGIGLIGFWRAIDNAWRGPRAGECRGGAHDDVRCAEALAVDLDEAAAARVALDAGFCVDIAQDRLAGCGYSRPVVTGPPCEPREVSGDKVLCVDAGEVEIMPIICAEEIDEISLTQNSRGEDDVIVPRSDQSGTP